MIDGLILSTISAIVLAPIYLRLVREMSEAFAAIVRAENAKLGAVIRALAIKAE